MGSRIASALWLLLVWVLLWGRVTPVVVVLGGVVVAAALTWGIRLPEAQLRLRVRPWLLLAELTRLFLDVVRSTAQLALAALRGGAEIRSSVVLVPLQTRDEGFAVLVATWMSLAPGTLAVDADADGLVLHVVPARDAAAVRQEAQDVERRLLRAVGAETQR